MISLQPATADDETYLYNLHRATMRDLVEQVWGWDEPMQQEFFREHIAAGNHFRIQLKDENVVRFSIMTKPTTSSSETSRSILTGKVRASGQWSCNS